MDIYLINGNFDIGTNGDLRILDEDQTLKQDIYNRIRTIKGSHFLYPDYGVDLVDYLNSNQDETTLLELINSLQDQIEQDPRVYEAEVEIKERTTEGIKLLIKIYPIADAPFSLEIDKFTPKFIVNGVGQ